MPKIDLTGQRFGKLVVIKEDLNKKGHGVQWVCQCDCGNVKTIAAGNLKSGGTKSCGCLHKSNHTNDLRGQRFGKLTVLKDSGKRTKSRGVIWLCECDCGKQCEVSGTNLLQHYTMSCGCLKQSHGEYIIENLLKRYGINYTKEYVFKDLKTPRGGYARFDFAIFNKDNNTLQYLIEYDGETHDYSHISGWNTVEKISYQQKCDQLKNEYCEAHQIPLIRISYKNLDNIEISQLIL